jgi:hypothetical protein
MSTSQEILASVKFEQLVLLDVQGLWGGRDLWIAADGSAVCRIAGLPTQNQTGLQETRSTFSISAGQATALAGLIKKHKILRIKTEDRCGQPDEARPIIYIRMNSKTHAVAKWANDKHRDFDPIYELLLKIVETGKQATPRNTGAYDWEWRPEGSPVNRTLREITAPIPGNE